MEHNWPTQPHNTSHIRTRRKATQLTRHCTVLCKISVPRNVPASRECEQHNGSGQGNRHSHRKCEPAGAFSAPHSSGIASLRLKQLIPLLIYHSIISTVLIPLSCSVSASMWLRLDTSK
ncbi:hypothetical protein TRVL_06860 [Trypanosoma vivax]|nr:hypothetical protein TRVL_06860 [Trypanosoma vivax]